MIHPGGRKTGRTNVHRDTPLHVARPAWFPCLPCGESYCRIGNPYRVTNRLIRKGNHKSSEPLQINCLFRRRHPSHQPGSPKQRSQTLLRGPRGPGTLNSEAQEPFHHGHIHQVIMLSGCWAKACSQMPPFRMLLRRRLPPPSTTPAAGAQGLHHHTHIQRRRGAKVGCRAEGVA